MHVKTSDLLRAQQWVPSHTEAAAVVPGWGAVMVTKYQWASGLIWTVIKCLCLNTSSSMAFLRGLQSKMGNVWNSARVWRIRVLIHCLLLVWTPPPPEDWCYLHIHPLCVHVSYACTEVLPISFYRPFPVWIKNSCVSEELLDLVFIVAKVLFTYGMKKIWGDFEWCTSSLLSL